MHDTDVAFDVETAVRHPELRVGLVMGDDGDIKVAPKAGKADFTLPPIYAERLGDRRFIDAHGTHFAYVVGAMARGITTAQMVIEAQRAGFAAFFGSAGLDIATIEAAIDEIQAALGNDAPGWGSNLIHSPQTPEAERATIDLYLAKGVRRVSASAFMSLSPEIVRFAAKGMRRLEGGLIERRHHVFAKVSHPTVARAFMSPAPETIVSGLRERGDLTDEEAELIAQCPVSCDITAEADSGGHTDNRPASALLPALMETRRAVADEWGLVPETIRIGLAGGIGTPNAVASAFAMGAAYVVTGSINQPALESGLSAPGKAMLADVALDDIAMAPAADMFERGVKVQVLRRGTFFAVRAERLYQLYRTHEGIDALPAKDRAFVETCLGESVEEAWAKTLTYLDATRPADAARARKSAKAQLGFLFRRYLFQCAQWSREGDEAHRAEYQIWCGPALGAFNSWVQGSELERLDGRTVRSIGHALVHGAAQVTRAHTLRSAGVAVPAALFRAPPPIKIQTQAVA